MPRKISQPEDDWRGASLEQIADLRAWVLLRMSERHADNVASFLLTLDAEDAPEHTKRQLSFYRTVLEEYGEPRPVGASGEGAEAAEPASPAEPPPGGPDGTEPTGTAARVAPSGPGHLRRAT